MRLAASGGVEEPSGGRHCARQSATAVSDFAAALLSPSRRVGQQHSLGLRRPIGAASHRCLSANRSRSRSHRLFVSTASDSRQRWSSATFLPLSSRLSGLWRLSCGFISTAATPCQFVCLTSRLVGAELQPAAAVSDGSHPPLASVSLLHSHSCVQLLLLSAG
jgi:hypothetical protein